MRRGGSHKPCLTGNCFVSTLRWQESDGDCQPGEIGTKYAAMPARQGIRFQLHQATSRVFPERRIFLRSDTETRFVRLSPESQLLAVVGCTLFIAWSIIATAVVMMDTIGSGGLREQAAREQALYEQRLNEISAERDQRAREAEQAHIRFNAALNQVSEMQLTLLASEDRRKEMERGLDVVQQALRRTIQERDAARAEWVTLQATMNDEQAQLAEKTELAATVDFLTDTLDNLSGERDAISQERASAVAYAQDLELEQKLIFERNDRIFSQLEDAVSLSLSPLDGMFRAAGMSTDRILEMVKAGYSGQGGPLMPLTFSTKGNEPDPDSLRANAILERLDRMNLYRIAAEKVPLDFPLKSAYRFTSGFGMRWGRMHEGTDMAAPYGTPVYATADGVVVHAGWQGAYGRLIKIRHEFGIETRFAHLSQIRVKVGQRVSRGDRIGDMGNSGRSTGTHLHYEIRVNGNAMNPMKYIKAGQNVF